MIDPNPPTGAIQTAYQQARQRASDLLSSGQRELAVVLLRDLMKQQPKDVLVLRMLGVALQGSEEMAVKSKEPESVRLLRFASQLSPGDPELLVDLAASLRAAGRIREAFGAVDKALAADPAHARAIMYKSRLLQSTNRIEQAIELISERRKHDPDPMLAVGYADLCLHQKRHEDGIRAIRPLFDDITAPVARRIEAAFLLGHLHDAIGDYDTAFEYYQTGNTMIGVEPASDFVNHIEMWTRERIEAVPRAQVDTSRAVLVIGMPRSGTTLTEMILAAHPRVSGIGESTLINRLAHRNPIDKLADKQLIDAYAREYLEMLDRQNADPQAVRVVDKMPENYIHLSMISRMLPDARIIHCKRDARDTCLSIFFQQFGPWIKYARSLETIAEQYLGYLRLMDHWRDTLDLDIHESVYEQLTAEPEPRVRALLEHIRVGFDPACLEPHKTRRAVNTASIAQVRRPIYKSSRRRWKNYEKHIGPLLERLEGV
ncbi:MAG: sulfotransferase [Phycisphaerales bacterium]|nr:sulfotransferase [Planctomycetota bacterium]MCH8507323.1 sulfotransferase [Phycisphaerales bacterium]